MMVLLFRVVLGHTLSGGSSASASRAYGNNVVFGRKVKGTRRDRGQQSGDLYNRYGYALDHGLLFTSIYYCREMRGVMQCRHHVRSKLFRDPLMPASQKRE